MERGKKTVGRQCSVVPVVVEAKQLAAYMTATLLDINLSVETTQKSSDCDFENG